MKTKQHLYKICINPDYAFDFDDRMNNLLEQMEDDMQEIVTSFKVGDWQYFVTKPNLESELNFK